MREYNSYQWSPVGIQISQLQVGKKLTQRHDQEVQVEKKFELLIQNLRTENINQSGTEDKICNILDRFQFTSGRNENMLYF